MTFCVLKKDGFAKGRAVGRKGTFCIIGFLIFKTFFCLRFLNVLHVGNLTTFRDVKIVVIIWPFIFVLEP